MSLTFDAIYVLLECIITKTALDDDSLLEVSSFSEIWHPLQIASTKDKWIGKTRVFDEEEYHHAHVISMSI